MKIPLRTFTHWDVVALLTSLGLAGGLELLGVFGGHRYVTITQVIRDYLPKWVLAMVWGWLGYHFIFPQA